MPVPVGDQRLRPRRRPRQARSHETRVRILEAARATFAAHGYAAGTTNRIAAAAGLSVGSLYQYFPNKDAILVELVDDHMRAGAERVAGALTAVLAAHEPGLPPLDVLIGAVVDGLVEVHGTDRLLHRVLTEQAPRPPDQVARLRAIEEDIVARATALLAGHPEVRVPDVAVAARMAVLTIEGLVHGVVTDDSTPVPDAVFRREATRMVVGYLSGGTGVAPPTTTSG